MKSIDKDVLAGYNAGIEKIDCIGVLDWLNLNGQRKYFVKYCHRRRQ